MKKIILTGKVFIKISGSIIIPLILLCAIPLHANSQNKLDSLLNLLKQAENDSIAIEINIRISREHHKFEAHQEDILYATKAVESALLLNNPYLYAKALNNLGLLYRYHQQYADAVPLHKKAFDITEHLDIPSLDKMIFANNTGVASRHNSDYITAVDYYLKALNIAERENDLKNIEIASNGLGNTLIAIPNRAEEALTYLERALKIAKATKNKLGIAMNYLTISDYYGHRGQYIISRKYLDDLLQVNRELKDNYGMAMTYQSIGNSYLNENKDLQTAKANFNISLDLFIKLNDNLRQADAQYSLGTVFFREKKLINSLQKFEESLSIAKVLKNKKLIMKNAEMISLIYEELSDPKNALTYYKISQQYKDSINLFEQETEIAAINNRYNFEKKETEIEILKKDKSLQDSQLAITQEKLRNRSIIIFLMSFSLFSFILLVFLQQRNRRTRLNTEKKLQQQEKEKIQAVYEKNLMEAEMLATRMQVNPHFLFNCLNSIKYMIQSDQNEKAIGYLVIFSRFIRMVLETSNKPLSTICEELELVRYYLQLEESRFNDDFSFSIKNKIEVDLNKLLLPTLLLQPFVENAIWHGLLPSENNKKLVTLTVDHHKDGIQIIIDDNGVGRKNAVVKDQHKSMGNKITYERIQLFNKNNPNTIDCEIVDKTDSAGNPTGTSVILVMKKKQDYLQAHFEEILETQNL